MLEAFSLPFMQRALLAGLLIGAMTSYLGVFVVQRRMSFLGSGLGHAALGGVALGIYLGFEPAYVALPFTVLVGLLIVWVKEKGGLGGDTAVGIFFALSVALGILLLALKNAYGAEALAYLFGSILAVGPADLKAALFVAFLVLILLPFWGHWAYATFDRDLAAADRVPVRRDDYLLTALIAAVVVVGLKVVGILLVAAFLVLPAASARLVARTFAGMTLFSMLFGVLGVVLGLILAYAYDVPSGAAIILVEGALFLLILMVKDAKTLMSLRD
jgi:zinc transport system permease protein